MTRYRFAARLLSTFSICFLLEAASQRCLAQNAFEIVPGPLSQISVGADGAVWGVDFSQRIFTYDSTTDQFVQVPGALTQIAVGNANAVWRIDAQNLIFHWDSATQSWTYTPGSLTQIAVGADGDAWELNAQNQVWHYNQQLQAWDYIYGFNINGTQVESFTQITVGNDGSVYAIGVTPTVPTNSYWYNPGTGRFQQVTGAFTYSGPYQFNPMPLASISVGANGDLWGLSDYDCHYSPLQPQWNCINSNVT